MKNKIEKNVLKMVREVVKPRSIDPFFPARCISIYHQPKRPKA